MSRYRIVESVGSRVERVRDYEDLEIHHPSYRGREPGRTYANVDGYREEVSRERTRGGQLLVSKDFVLQDADRPGARVRVPAPVEGVIGRVDAANGRVDIYDRLDGELLVRIRHMDLRGSPLEVGDRVGYGQQLGWQSGFGGGRPDRYGVHVHVDFNAAHLARFDRYLRDLDTGAITPDGGRPAEQPRRHATAPVTATPTVPASPGSRRVLESGSQGVDVEGLQRTLARLGYHDAEGRAIQADGDYGRRTREAVERFQRDNGQEPDGRVGRDTHRALSVATAVPRHDVLGAGSEGAAVEHLQRTLSRLGYHDNSGRALVVDGDFGRRTHEAVEAFQRDRGLDVDGRVGRDTSAELAKARERLVSEPGHPRHGLYQQAVNAVANLERSKGMPAGPHSERIAGALCACAVQEGLTRIDRIELNNDRSLVRAVEVSTLRDEPGLNRATQPVPTAAAASASLVASSELLRERVDEPTRVHDEMQARRPAMLSV